MKETLTALFMFCLCIKAASANPWPADVSIAFAEEIHPVCAKLQPKKKDAFQARKELLYSEAPEVVAKIKRQTNFNELKQWARDEIARATKPEVIELCNSFLTDSGLALRQDDANDRKPEPVEK